MNNKLNNETPTFRCMGYCVIHPETQRCGWCGRPAVTPKSDDITLPTSQQPPLGYPEPN